MMWKGHLSWKVYIPSKCATFGINHLNCVKPNLVMYGILLFTLGRITYSQYLPLVSSGIIVSVMIS
jgi:hypothetical protein